ncbi:multicopper oxidase [Piedraia hortae CBS 480.64]|uniref:Multicopper oxidase n=1 Tax=Piedraia hortae CBS 480.64 TaxID=1314780 RepID=A0A6A7C605_9PEZI|nr:multicopper oxidase [Piedraia hortae CBS 480.64]
MSLTSLQQAGSSSWGLLKQATFPQWLGDSKTAPWGSCTVSSCHYTNPDQVPVTADTRKYEFTISRSVIYADGVARDVILVNDQFPGPVIEANWGDWVEVKVNNNITSPEEGTSLHWHGQPLANTPWEDGVSGISQCPIAPGTSFTYRWRAEAHGTSWYHAHMSAQYAAGVAGPMIVYGPTSQEYDIDVGPVMLSDWYHIPYFALVKDAVGKNYSVIPPVSDSVLINGRGQFDCNSPTFDESNDSLSSSVNSNLTWTCVPNAPVSRFRFQSGKVHRLRLINHGANGVQKFSIDRHVLRVIAYDYVPVEPYDTKVVTLGVGQRADVLVDGLDDPQAAVWMRTSAPGGEACGGSSSPDAKAAVYYESARANADPGTDNDASWADQFQCRNEDLSLTRPSYRADPIPYTDSSVVVQNIDLTLVLNGTGHFEFRVNGRALRANESDPLLGIVGSKELIGKDWNVFDLTPKSPKAVVFNLTNNMPLTHPFHLHGHEFSILSLGGPIEFNSSVPSTPNGISPDFEAAWTWPGDVPITKNPMRRDSVLIPPYGFAVVQFELINPGVWPFHCHVAWHLSGGQGWNVVYGFPDLHVEQALPDEGSGDPNAGKGEKGEEDCACAGTNGEL